MSVVNANIGLAAPECATSLTIGFYMRFLLKLALPLSICVFIAIFYSFILLHSYIVRSRNYCYLVLTCLFELWFMPRWRVAHPLVVFHL